MSRIYFTMLALSLASSVFAQQSLTPRVAVYNIEGERYVVDSARMIDSALVLYVGDLSFKIAEDRFARLEPIPGASFSTLDQIYSFSLKSGKTIVGQLVHYKRGILLIRTSDTEEVSISLDELQGVHREKRNTFEQPWVRRCANTNFIPSPYALKAREIVFTSFLYGNSFEIGLGDGFSARVVSTPVPVVLPTGYNIAYKKKFEQSNFSVGLSAGQIWIGAFGGFFREDRVNSVRNFMNLLTPSITYHRGSAFLKTGLTVFSGSTGISRNITYMVTSTASFPGIKRPHHRWNFTLNLSQSEPLSLFQSRAVLLAGYQGHTAKTSYTVGVGLAKGDRFFVLPFMYASFSLYASEEQKKVSKAFDAHRRLKVVKRVIKTANVRERLQLKRDAEKSLKNKKRSEK